MHRAELILPLQPSARSAQFCLCSLPAFVISHLNSEVATSSRLLLPKLSTSNLLSLVLTVLALQKNGITSHGSPLRLKNKLQKANAFSRFGPCLLVQPSLILLPLQPWLPPFSHFLLIDHSAFKLLFRCVKMPQEALPDHPHPPSEDRHHILPIPY